MKFAHLNHLLVFISTGTSTAIGATRPRVFPRVSSHQSLPSLHILLAPVYPSSQPGPPIPDGINVTLSVPAWHFPADTALLSLPLSIGLTPTARYDGDAITVSDGRGIVPMSYADTGPGANGGDAVRIWYPTRPLVGHGSGGDVVVRFFAPARHVDNTTLVGPRIDLRKDAGGGLVGQGIGFIPVPPPQADSEQWAIAVEWDLNNAPPGTHAACSFGDDEGDADSAVPGQSPALSNAVGLLSDYVSSTIFAVGKLKRFPDWRGGNGAMSRSSMSSDAGEDDEPAFALYWIGDPPFDMTRVPAQVEETYRAMAGFFSSRDPFRVFFRQVENSFGGTGAMLSFLVEWSEVLSEQMSRETLLDLLAHEAVHEYALMEMGPPTPGIQEDETAWYDEGIANYYSAIATFRGAPSQADRAFLRWQLNGYTQGYYTSPVVGMRWFDVLEHYWESLHILRVSHNRGFVYLAWVNGKIRAATGGAKSLDDVVLELYRRRMANQPHGLPEWHSLVSGLIGPEAERLGYDELLNGKLIVPPADSFAELGLRLVRQDAEMFELGFDTNSLRTAAMKISGLVKGSRAEQAGVREGDEVVRSYMVTLVADDLDGMMKMTVRRGDEEKTITWLPRSFKKVETWQWVDVEQSINEL